MAEDKVLYYDPNSFTSQNNEVSFNPDLMKNPEDLSIAVDLHVILKERGKINGGNGKTFTYGLIGANTPVNFLQGSALGGANVLTDFFANIGNKEDDVENISEAMCVSSIDIEFSSWYAASVIVNFTDVRGASLFTPSDYADTLRDSTQNVDNKNESLFRTFFSFPYPMYVLKIKGFYGAVSYPLHCSDFKAQFNATTGNFDITVTFIGYTYAMLNDVQMSYLMAAPYCSYVGADYWDSQLPITKSGGIGTGRFASSDGQPLPKIVDLMAKIKKGEYNLNQISQTQFSKDLTNKRTENNLLIEIRQLIIIYFESLKNEYNKAIIDGLTITNLIIATPKIASELTPYLITQIDEINKKIAEYKKSFSTSIIFNNYNSELDSKPKLNGSTYEINLKSIGNSIDSSIELLNTKIKSLSENVDTLKNRALNEAYEITPNLFNYFKILVAHMETFYHMIDECATKVGVDRIFPATISINNTDGNVKYNNNKKPILPPFPWYTEKGDGGKDQDAWIGNVAPNLEEVELVSQLINSRINTKKEVEQLVAIDPSTGQTTVYPNSELTIGEIWFPINAFDNSINLIGGKSKTGTPYSNIKDITKESIYDRLFLRTYIPTTLSYHNNEYYNLALNYAISESVNVFDALSKDEISLATLKAQLKLLSGEKDSNNTLMSNSGYFNVGLDFGIKGSETDFLPLFEDNRKTFEEYHGAKDTKKMFETKKRWLSYKKSDINPMLFNQQTTFIAVFGNNNCDQISTEYYLKLVNKLKTNYQKIEHILDHYSFIDNTNNPISCAYYLGSSDSSTTNIINQITENPIYPLDLDKQNNRSKTPTLRGPEYEIYKHINFNNPNSLYVDNLSFLIKDFYYLYQTTGDTQQPVPNKPNSEILKAYLNKKDYTGESIKNYSYPFIGGYDNDFLISLFGHQFFYAQFNQPKIKNYHQAFLFLNTLDIDIEKITSLFTENRTDYNLTNYLNRNSFMARIPKSGLLLIGAMLWRFKNEKQHPFMNYGNIILPKRYEYFKIINKNNSFGFCNGYYTPCNLFFIDETLSNTEDKYQSIFSTVEEDDLIDIFTKWADSKNWIDIIYQFSLKYTKGSELVYFNPIKLNEVINSLTENINTSNKILKKEIKNTNSYYYISKNTDSTISPSRVFTAISTILSDSVTQQSLLLINADGTPGVKAIIDLLMTDCVIAYSGNSFKINNKKDKQTSIINNFKSNLNTITTKKVSSKINSSSTSSSTNQSISSLDEHEDMNLSTYTYIKIIYDKWVSGFSDSSQYKWITNIDDSITNPSNFKALPILSPVNEQKGSFIKNFRFIDRAHNDIGIDMLINYRDIFNNISDSNIQKTLFSAMTDVLQQNQMLFLPMPSYQSFNNVNELSEIFKPIPFIESKMVNSKDDLDSSMYICMYAGRPSSKLDQGSNSPFKNDGYPLNEPHNLPGDYRLNTDDSKVPAVAVNFGQQNQQYFKNYSLNMSNPNTTDASIMVLKNLNERANQNSTLEPIGQDLYSLYSQYSYTCDVEMMGCAQIQPMMYFQLNNIPMWNGAYMIFKVKHSIKPGAMVTNFTGMRMAKTYPKLVKENAVTFKLLSSFDVTIDVGNAPVEVKDTVKISDITTNNDYFINNSDHFKIKEYFKIGTDKNENYPTNKNGLNGLPTTFKEVGQNTYNRVNYLSKIVEIIYSTWMSESTNTPFVINSGYRTNPINNQSSAHLLGLAVDLQIPGQTSKSQMQRLLDVLQNLMVKGLPIDQAFLEHSKKSPSSYWLHVGLAKQTSSGSKIPIIVDGRYKSRGSIWEYVNSNELVEILAIPQAQWPLGDAPSTQDISRAPGTPIYIIQKYIKDTLKEANLTNYQVAAIMGNIEVESGFDLNNNPPATNKGKINPNHDNFYGLIQWRLKTYHTSPNQTYDDFKNTVIGTTKELQTAFLLNKTDNFNKFKTSTSTSTLVEDITEKFATIVEVCTSPEKCDWAKRKRLSREYFIKLTTPGDYLYWG